MDVVDAEYQDVTTAGRAVPRRRTGIVTDPRCSGHCMGPGEPECPERLDVLRALVAAPGLAEHLFDIAARQALTAELRQVHAERYVARIASTAGKGAVYLDEDTRTSPLSHEAALLAAGGICEAIKAVNDGAVDNAFAMVRPPGHHAERAAAKGFCLFNNAAVGARYAQRSLGLARILIVDWDLHHGNGTQHCFEDDPTVLFFSTHRAFTYPHSGSLKEVGRANAKGHTMNIPLLPGFGDGEYLRLFEAVLKPVALAFDPDLVMVSAGFDIHVDDPMGGMRVTPEGFAGMTRVMMDIADTCCQGRLVMTLEGGYGLNGLRDSVREVLREMIGLRHTDVRRMAAAADSRKTDEVIWRVRRRHGRYWPNLGAASDAAPPLGVRLKGALARWAAYLGVRP